MLSTTHFMHQSIQEYHLRSGSYMNGFGKLALHKFFWGMWGAAVLLVVFIYSLTISVAPYLHADEFMTLDLGRIVLHPNTGWSIAWITSKDHPVFFIFYLGPVFQELCYTAFGQYAPRISAIIGALVASTILVKWLLLKGTNRNAAFILGLVFLLDPIFVQAYTMARVDGWTMAFCLLSCCLIVRSASLSLNYKRLKINLFFAGFLAAIGLFIWPSAIFLYPLIAFELFTLFGKLKVNNISIKQLFALFILTAVGGIIAVLIILIPISSYLIQQFNNLVDGVTVNTHSGIDKGSTYVNLISSAKKMIGSLKFTPVVSLLAAVAFCIRKQIGLLLVCLIAAFAMMASLVYINRVQYLLPYLIVAIAEGYSSIMLFATTPKIKRFSELAVLLLLISWAALFSLGIRSYFALFQSENRNRNLIYTAATTLIGKGNHRVIAPFEFYYPGRKLGWQMYGAYIAYDEVFTSEMFANLLSHVDYVILKNEEEISEKFILQMKNEGLNERDYYKVYSLKNDRFNGKNTFTSRIRNLYSIFRKPYGPYKLFVRTASRTPHLSKN